MFECVCLCVCMYLCICAFVQNGIKNVNVYLDSLCICTVPVFVLACMRMDVSVYTCAFISEFNSVHICFFF